MGGKHGETKRGMIKGAPPLGSERERGPAGRAAAAEGTKAQEGGGVVGESVPLDNASAFAAPPSSPAAAAAAAAVARARRAFLVSEFSTCLKLKSRMHVCMYVCMHVRMYVRTTNRANTLFPMNVSFTSATFDLKSSGMN